MPQGAALFASAAASRVRAAQPSSAAMIAARASSSSVTPSNRPSTAAESSFASPAPVMTVRTVVADALGRRPGLRSS